MKNILIFILTIFGILSVQCIKRDNLWDPCNGCHPLEELPGIRYLYQSQIDTLKSHSTSRLQSQIPEITAQFTKTVAENQLLTLSNNQIFDSAAHISEYNATAERFNDSINDCKSAHTKLLFGNLKPVKMNLKPTLVPQLRQHIDTLVLSRDSCNKLFTAANNECAQQVVIHPALIDSIIGIYDSVISTLTTLASTIDSQNTLWSDVNKSVDERIAQYPIADSLAVLYNKDILFCRLPRETDPKIIEQKLATLQPGDTIAIDTSMLRIGKIELKNIGTTSSPWTVIMGSPLGGTLLESDHVEIQGSAKIYFANITFHSTGAVNGVRVIDGSDSVRFVNCHFRNNLRRGVEILRSRNVALLSSTIMYNGTGAGAVTNPEDANTDSCGIRIESSQNIEITSVLIARNRGHGIDILSSFVIIKGCTVSDNSLYGVQYTGGTNQGTVEVYSTLFCYSSLYAINRVIAQQPVDFIVRAEEGNRFFANELGAMGGDQQMAAENAPFTEADPQFVDRDHDNYRIGPASPLNGTGIGYQY